MFSLAGVFQVLQVWSDVGRAERGKCCVKFAGVNVIVLEVQAKTSHYRCGAAGVVNVALMARLMKGKV
ncbi:hypothetical protein E2C01_054911 [Portunus trituberculatus]|uniref:Uncharacterized protein n=1 Tax=Portunus trituberculatus TaxID=210409 RepID=A0A5B7GPV3_PORTR|nr:hypothetical protein [Portunus trituberculatus]